MQKAFWCPSLPHHDQWGQDFLLAVVWVTVCASACGDDAGVLDSVDPLDSCGSASCGDGVGPSASVDCACIVEGGQSFVSERQDWPLY